LLSAPTGHKSTTLPESSLWTIDSTYVEISFAFPLAT